MSIFDLNVKAKTHFICIILILSFESFFSLLQKQNGEDT